MAGLSKSEQLRALRELKFSRKSSDGGVKESPARIPDYNGVKSLALVTAHGLPGKSCSLSLVVPSPSETTPLKRGRPFKPETKDKPWIALGMSRRTWYRRKAEATKKDSSHGRS